MVLEKIWIEILYQFLNDEETFCDDRFKLKIFFFLFFMICSVCNQNSGSYKCPNCRQPYCSLECYKIHQIYCLGKQKSEKDSNDCQNDQDEMINIPPFELFRCNKQIIDALGDPRLQKIIASIDSSPDREAALIQEMEINSDFESFVNQLLAAAPPTITP